MGGAVPSLCRGASRPVSLPGVLGAPGDTGWAWHGTPLLSAWVLGAGHGCYLRACSRWPPRLRCRGGGHPVRSPRGSMRTGRVGLVHPAGLEPACPWATPFEGVVYPGSTTDACSPCLLVKGADCAGVCLAVLAWLCPGLCVFCFSVLMGRSNTLTSPSGLARSFAGCRVASVGTVCPTYLPRALFSCGPRANRAGVRGALWPHQRVPPIE